MVDFVKEVLVRFRDVEAVDRALAFAAKLFIAFVPLLMVAGSIAPGRGGYGDRLVDASTSRSRPPAPCASCSPAPGRCAAA